MGIGQAISRVKEGVRRAGLEGVVAGLGEQLRSAAIPSALRPAAKKLADLLTLPAQEPVVSLHEAIAAHEMSSVSHAEVAAAGGVCPFSGANAGLAALLDASQFEAPAFEVAHTVDAVEPVEAQLVESVASETIAVGLPKKAKPPASKPAAAKTAAAKPAVAEKAIAEKPAVAASSVAAKAVSAKAAPAAKPVATKSQPAAKPSAKRVAKATEVVKAHAPEKKSHPPTEKASEKVAARPATSKTPARSTISPAKSPRPAAKRPVAKAVKKKD